MKRSWGLVAGAVLLLVGFGWLVQHLWAQRHASKQMAHVKQLTTELTGANAKNLSREERGERWQKLREESDKLTPEQRVELSRDMPMRKAMQERLDKFFKAEPAEQVAMLDEDIRRMEQSRQEWEKRRQEREQSRARNGGGSASGSGGPAGAAAGPPTGTNRTPEERDRRRREFLDMTTPQGRAQMAEYRRLRNERRQQLGLPPGRGPLPR